MLDRYFTMTVDNYYAHQRPHYVWGVHSVHGVHPVFTHTRTRARTHHACTTAPKDKHSPCVCKTTMDTMDSMDSTVNSMPVVGLVGVHSKNHHGHHHKKQIPTNERALCN